MVNELFAGHPMSTVCSRVQAMYNGTNIRALEIVSCIHCHIYKVYSKANHAFDQATTQAKS